jgi:hypothetical protein
MLRVFLVLLAAGQKLYARVQTIQAIQWTPYMTLVSYFNALRELGGARRIIEDEVRRRLMRFTDSRVAHPNVVVAKRQRGNMMEQQTSGANSHPTKTMMTTFRVASATS